MVQCWRMRNNMRKYFIYVVFLLLFCGCQKKHNITFYEWDRILEDRPLLKELDVLNVNNISKVKSIKFYEEMNGIKELTMQRIYDNSLLKSEIGFLRDGGKTEYFYGENKELIKKVYTEEPDISIIYEYKYQTLQNETIRQEFCNGELEREFKKNENSYTPKLILNYNDKNIKDSYIYELDFNNKKIKKYSYYESYYEFIYKNGVLVTINYGDSKKEKIIFSYDFIYSKKRLEKINSYDYFSGEKKDYMTQYFTDYDSYDNWTCKKYFYKGKEIKFLREIEYL